LSSKWIQAFHVPVAFHPPRRDGNSLDDVLRHRMDNLVKLVTTAQDRFFGKSARGM
jgi:hypothetical protein